MKAKLVKKIKEAEGTYSLAFKPDKPVSYLPGQYMYFTLPEMHFKDSRGPTRDFTLSSSPTEGEFIMFTTRIREQSGFKMTLDLLKIGSFIEIEGPNGTFILDEHEEGPHVFIAGGIGITPFRSMLKYKIDKKLKYHTHLIYSNSTPEQITFKKELENWVKTDNNFKLDMTITQPETSKIAWKGLTGRIDEILIKKLISRDELLKSTFWLCGPPAMVDAVEEVLLGMEVKADNIITDKFSGY